MGRCTLLAPILTSMTERVCSVRQRGKYRSRKSGLSDKEIADNLIVHICNALHQAVDYRACLLAFFEAKPSVQRRVLAHFRPAKARGAPRRAIPDHYWLEFVESWKATLQESATISGRNTRVSDLAAIEYGLTHSNSRLNRKPGQSFLPGTESGRAEIRRIRDATVRARRVTKSK